MLIANAYPSHHPPPSKQNTDSIQLANGKQNKFANSLAMVNLPPVSRVPMFVSPKLTANVPSVSCTTVNPMFPNAVVPHYVQNVICKSNLEKKDIAYVPFAITPR